MGQFVKKRKDRIITNKLLFILLFLSQILIGQTRKVLVVLKNQNPKITPELYFDLGFKSYVISKKSIIVDMIEVEPRVFPLKMFLSQTLERGVNCPLGPNINKIFSLEEFNSFTNINLNVCNNGSAYLSNFELKQPFKSIVCIEDNIVLNKSNVTNFKFRLKGQDWEDLPQNLFDKANQGFKISEILKIPSNYIGNIDFKGVLIVKNKYPLGTIFLDPTQPSFETNIITYTITSCSLKLLSSLPNMVKCAGGSDGSIRFKFDRDLESADEKLNLILKNSKGGVLGTRSVSASEFNNKNQEYIWEGIPSDTYILNYQVIKNNNGSIPLESNPIIVGTPEALSFTTTAIQPVSCYEGNNGQFMLTPGGGTGKYNYTISNVISNQVIATGEIARGTSTTLTGLKKGNIK
ncbi:SprB repeat-containing protein [Flavobacterium oreochromis]|uniref:SprB repeat-containing protein n=1 Tax=Flavobacterium oreochromis TaxID=2906078 RepID=UPI001CE6DBFD|nr:SprB repeat-containing protein [Flavobacterium oreochromis]QYS85495.1 SprB repeat-containing protein [Flavobacterium oreochromis]